MMSAGERDDDRPQQHADGRRNGMRRPQSTLRTIRPILGMIAAVALAARGVLDREHGGWALVLVAAVVVVAIVLRTYVYRD